MVLTEAPSIGYILIDRALAVVERDSIHNALEACCIVEAVTRATLLLGNLAVLAVELGWTLAVLQVRRVVVPVVIDSFFQLSFGSQLATPPVLTVELAIGNRINGVLAVRTLEAGWTSARLVEVSGTRSVVDAVVAFVAEGGQVLAVLADYRSA